MYEVKRNNAVQEKVRITDVNGAELILPVSITADDIIREYTACLKAVGAAEKELDAAKSADPEGADHLEVVYTEYGKAVLALMRCVFGPEGAEKLLTFYNGHYDEMLGDVFPFLESEVSPIVRNVLDTRKAKYTALR